MSRAHFKGASYLFGKWMQQAAEEIARGDGELKKARILHKGPNLRKTYLGLFAAKVLRMKRRA